MHLYDVGMASMLAMELQSLANLSLTAFTPPRTAQHANSNFGFTSATSDDWTVSILGGETVIPAAFQRIFGQMERSEEWRQKPGDLLRPPARGGLSADEIDRIIASLRADGQSPN